MPSPPEVVPPSLVRRLTPWVVAALVLGWLFWLTPRAELAAAFARVSLPTVAAVIVTFVTAGLAIDSLSTWLILSRALPDLHITYGEMVRIRGTTYLLGLVNYGAGQGGVVWYLVKRHGIPPLEAVGAVMLVAGVSLAVVAATAAIGVIAGGTPAHPVLKLVVLGVAAIFPTYLAILALRPAAARRIALLRPLIDVGLGGNLLGVAARVPQFVVLLTQHALLMYLFGVRPSFAAVLTLLPLVMFVSVVPVSPFGLGTSQATAVLLFAPFAIGATEPARQAMVLGYSLVAQFGSLLTQAMLGLIAWSFLRKSQPTAV